MENKDYLIAAREYIRTIGYENLRHSYSHSKTKEKLLSISKDSPFEIKFGATKLVLISKNTDIKKVIKLPFFHQEDGHKLNGAQNSLGLISDYCQTEVDIFQKAAYVGLDEVFLETQKIGAYNKELNIYIQDKVDQIGIPDNYMNRLSCSKEESSYLSYYSSNYGSVDLDTSFISILYDYYGKDFCDGIFSFILEENIYDLHDENYGFKDGRPVIFDYSGYNG